MGDSVSNALALLDDRLEELHALMTDDPVEVVRERYLGWKAATRAALVELVAESVVERFDLARGRGDLRDGHRPTPPVYLDGAASRAVLTAIKKDLEAAPASVLLVPPSESAALHPLGGIDRIIRLLERRLPRAFRGRPETELDVQNGFETLLAGAEIAYERQPDSIEFSSRTLAPDFTFPGLQAAVELKLCDGPDREREIAAEMSDEIAAYRSRYRQIVFGVYDLGFIRDPERFALRFETGPAVLIRVMKDGVA